MESRARYIRPLAQIGGEVGGPDLDGTGGLSGEPLHGIRDRKSTRLNSSHSQISYAVFCLKKKNKQMSDVHFGQKFSNRILRIDSLYRLTIIIIHIIWVRETAVTNLMYCNYTAIII